jgi:TonB-dependent SusC/RagA subfamily outer membrane receptor
VTRHSNVSGGTLFGWAMLALAQGCALSLPPETQPSLCDARTADNSRCVQVGYGVQPRRMQTGAIGSYIADAHDLSGVGRVEQMLEGRIPGVLVERIANGDYSVRIRGGLAGGNGGEPLIVVNGIPAPFGLGASTVLGSVIPATVARIDVLKDAGATAVYGARGVNGVILVTTRQ